jgi:hypothetical protein
MTYFLFTNPGETGILVSYKKEELGTTCFYNTIISAAGTTAPLPGSSVLKQRKKEKKRNTRG